MAHEPELRALGLESLALFGSTARGEAGPDSDVDLVVRLDRARSIGLFHFAAIRERIEDMLGVSVDLLAEPIEKDRLRERVERDRVAVF
ncbi:nucleotidyltransferase domain-containing protein [Sphingomonas sp. BIUV-7]|uniref:Nucleotidyltransferase domain-containing protein n=1 Tax=Sphingomonas natans TaxID=3063330 RepID=A0ABT8Y5Y5_9SPHN|nr:nucleotidyltransferase domain-containing protein [Sphingomonas sp. BIUV-7]MDO6413738.1 nucleotidyltransferase domain-containing protein [Sphingomonas sp. BIUV-7]